MNKSDFQTPKRFDYAPICNVQDRLFDCNRKLKCMSAMIAATDLECFGSREPEGETLRCGLSCILNEIADEHEKNIKLLVADYDRCPEAIINNAFRDYNTLNNSLYDDTGQALGLIDEHVGKLEGVLSTFGDEYPAVKDIWGRLLDLKKQISASLQVTGQEMRQAV